MKNLTALDKTALSLLAFLGILSALAVLIGQGRGARVVVDIPQDGLVGPYQKITFTFSEPVELEQASSLIDFTPPAEGIYEQTDDRTLIFSPALPYLRAQTYTLTLRAGALEKNGTELKKEQEWKFKIRDPRIAFIYSLNGTAGLWTVDENGESLTQLTNPQINVMDFDVSRNGELIVFNSPNESGGIDFWQITRTEGEKKLLDCGRDRCTTPSISPDGLRIAYSREEAGPGPDLPFGSPRVWALNIKAGSNAPVYEDRQILGYRPEWSPDGKQIASYDGLADQIRLANLETGEQYAFNSNTGGPVTWSPDSKRFLYTNIPQNDAGLRTFVQEFDFEAQKSYTLIGENDDMDYAYNALAWSPVKEKALLGMRAGGEDPSQILWLFDPGQLDGFVIADQPDYSYSSPEWNVWGDQILFQQFKLKGVYSPEIALWDEDSGELMAVTNGIFPQWLP